MFTTNRYAKVVQQELDLFKDYDYEKGIPEDKWPEMPLIDETMQPKTADFTYQTAELFNEFATKEDMPYETLTQKINHLIKDYLKAIKDDPMEDK